MLHPDGSTQKRKECGEMSAATSAGHVMSDKVLAKTQKVSTESDDRQKSCLDQDTCMSSKSVFQSPSKSPIGQNKENNESHASGEENSTEIHGTLDMEVDEIPGNNSDDSMDDIIEIDDSDSDILHKSDNHGNEIGNCQGIIASKNDEFVCEVGKVEEKVVVTEIVGEKAEWDRGMEEKVELTGIKSMVGKPSYQNEEGKVNCLPGSDGFEHSDSDMGGDNDDENLQRNPEVMDEHTSGEKEPAQSKDSEQCIRVRKNNVRCSGVESSGVASRTRAKSGSRVVAAEKKFLSIKWKNKDVTDKRQSKLLKVKDIEAIEVSDDLEDEAGNCGEESQSTNTYSLRKRKRFSYAEDRYGDWEIAGVGGQSDPDYASMKKWNKRRRSESFDKSGFSKSKSRGENACVDLEKDLGNSSHETSKENSGGDKTDPGYLVEEEFETVDGGGVNHVKTEAEENEYDCAVCLSTFCTEEELEDHNKIHRNIDIHKCGLCSKSFLAAHHLRRHVRECRLTFGLTACDLCGYMPVNNIDGGSHAKGHRVQNPYPCLRPECKSRLPTYDSVVNHFKNKHCK